MPKSNADSALSSSSSSDRPPLPRLDGSRDTPNRLPSFVADRLPPLVPRDITAPTLPSLSSLTDELRDKRPLTRSRSNSLRRAASTSGVPPLEHHHHHHHHHHHAYRTPGPHSYSPPASDRRLSAQWARGQSEVRSMDDAFAFGYYAATGPGHAGRPALPPSSATSWSSSSGTGTSLPPLSSITSSLPSPATPTAPNNSAKRARGWGEEEQHALRRGGWGEEEAHRRSGGWDMDGAQKRVWEDLSVGERQEAVQRVLQRFMRRLAAKMGDQGSVVDDFFVTVTCSHSGVAQKSYGHEKRFLCPPPIVRVRGPGYTTPSATPSIARQLRMTILPGAGGEQNAHELAVSEDVILDRTLQAKFGHLHVGGSTSAAKTFRLRFDMIATDRGGQHAWKSPRLSGSYAGADRYPWLTCESEPIAVISKPSKKTTKAKTSSSQITPDLAICLFNRVNSQNVRTKYMAVDDGQLSARNDSWTTFHMRPVVTASSASSASSTSINDPSAALHATDAVTYGSIVVLEAPGRGAVSDPMVVCKVDKGKIIVPAAFGGTAHAQASSSDSSFDGPISQMQKVAFMRYDPSSATSRHATPSRRFLCSSPPEPWWSTDTNATLANATPANASASTHTAQAAPMRTPDGSTSSYTPQHGVVGANRGDAGMVPTPLTFMPPGRGPNPNEPAPATLGPRDADVANDAFCWSVVGAASFHFSFTQMGLSVESAGEAPAPQDPPGVLPSLCNVPRILHEAHVLRLEGERLALGGPGVCWKVWLGGMGPLPQMAESTSLVAGYGSGAAVNAVTVLDVRLPALDALLPYCRSLRAVAEEDVAATLPTSLPIVLVRDVDGTIVKTAYSLELFRGQEGRNSLALAVVAG
ncbi:hypothetical protein BDZ90DRAFT_279886 [Jaminaea rosea]|uniref:LAG1-DNAbind-domain-containing protein n=1 Tax=Jaminaea rosea TaxID=1569628 RepID=A0A316UQI9_9BASI|nr:hypothetical protein BDZ90DRAFT_279886 [Jaminaea rosea]PWN27556.1 hypothetical protein BDZ90DRAFT_279886 [Jaminaea rosea]